MYSGPNDNSAPRTASNAVNAEIIEKESTHSKIAVVSEAFSILPLSTLIAVNRFCPGQLTFSTEIYFELAAVRERLLLYIRCISPLLASLRPRVGYFAILS